MPSAMLWQIGLKAQMNSYPRTEEEEEEEEWKSQSQTTPV